MKKRIVSIILAVIMIVGMLPMSAITALADEREEEPELLSETIYFNYNKTEESEHFTLTADYCDSNGWYGGSENDIITIAAKSNENLIIRKIEAVVTSSGFIYSEVGISSGTKEETGGVSNGATVHISGIDAPSFSFAGGLAVPFKDITIYYTSHTHNPTEISAKQGTAAEHGVSATHYYCKECGKYFADADCKIEITKETADGYIIHNWSDWSQGNAFGHTHICTCTGCDQSETEAHTGHIGDGVCDVCGYSGIFAETIVFNNSKTAESEHFKLEAGWCSSYGWDGGGSGEFITITPKNNDKLLIKDMEAVIGAYGFAYDKVGISSGTKEETGEVSNGATVHISGIDALSFSFADGTDYSAFKDITIYYTSHTHNPTLISAKQGTATEHGISTTHYYCGGCRKYFSDANCENEITKAAAESYIIHNWSEWTDGGDKGHIRTCTCTGCDISDSKAHTGYIDDGICDVCGHTGTFAETIVFNKSYKAESEHFTLTDDVIGSYGWYGGRGSVFSITSKNKGKLMIRNIDAVIGAYGDDYGGVGVSSGTKKETGSVQDGSTVHIENVDALSFSFIDGGSYSAFKDITVYCTIHTHTPTEISAKEETEAAHGLSTTYYECEECGMYFADADCKNEISKATVDSYTIHNWSDWSQGDCYGHPHTCTVCNKTEIAAHTGHFDDGVCDECGYSGIFAETIVFNNSTSAESESFTLTAKQCDSYGWCGGKAGVITITPKNKGKLMIGNIDAVIGAFGSYYGSVGVSSGTKKETGKMSTGSTAHIENVDALSFSFVGGGDYLAFKDITVYYTLHTHTPTEISTKQATAAEHGNSTAHYYCKECGMYFSDVDCKNEISQATVDSYIIHNWSEWSKGDYKGHTHSCTCTGCAAKETKPHTGYFGDGVCDECGYSGIFAETFVFSNSNTAESESFTLTAKQSDSRGWFGGDKNYVITITPKNKGKLMIRNIDAVNSLYGSYFRSVGVSSGTKKETGEMYPGSTVHIENVDALSFSFAGGTDFSIFKDITVYYTFHTHKLTEMPAREATEAEHGFSVTHYYCKECGMYFSDADCKTEISQATVDSYIIHNWSEWSKGDYKGHTHSCTCTGCAAKETKPHTGYFGDGVCDECGYSGIFAETFVFNNSTSAESESFMLTAGGCANGDGVEGGWRCGYDGITIKPKIAGNLLIRNMEAVIGGFGNYYVNVVVSSGEKEEPGGVANGSTVHISNVDDYSFSFADNNALARFKTITVIYEVHTHKLTKFSAKKATATEHGISTAYYYCGGCGKYFSDPQGKNEITEATVDGYALHYWANCVANGPEGHTHTCTVCNLTEKTAHTGQFDDGVCDECGYSGVFAETIIFNNSTSAESVYFTLTTHRYGIEGWLGGSVNDVITITPKNNGKLFIKNIEAIIGYYGDSYGSVDVSSGKKEERGGVADGSTVHISNVNDYFFSFADGTGFSEFKEITIFYEVCNPTKAEEKPNNDSQGKGAQLSSTFSGGNLWLIGGIAAAVIIGVAAYVVVKKKKKKTATANGAEKEDEK